MKYPNAAKGIKKIYIAEILGILAAVLLIVMVSMTAASGVDKGMSGEAVAQTMQAADMGAPFVVLGVVMMLVMLLLTVPALKKGRLFRWQGITLLAIYAAFCIIQFTL